MPLLKDTKIKEFYLDKEMMADVHEYLVQFLRETAIDKVFSRKDVSAIAEANEIIDEAFAKLDEIFGSKPKKKIINEAR